MEGVARGEGLECGGRGVHTGQVLELLLLERLLDGAQAIGPLRMAGRRQVIETGRVGDEQGGHDRHLLDCGRSGKGRVLFSFMKFELVLAKSSSATTAADAMGTEAAPIRGSGEGRQLETDRPKPGRSQATISGKPETGTHVTSFNLIKGNRHESRNRAMTPRERMAPGFWPSVNTSRKQRSLSGTAPELCNSRRA